MKLKSRSNRGRNVDMSIFGDFSHIVKLGWRQCALLKYLQSPVPAQEQATTLA